MVRPEIRMGKAILASSASANWRPLRGVLASSSPVEALRPTSEERYRQELRGLDPSLLEAVVEECAADPDRNLPDWRELKRRTEDLAKPG